ncbi:hypothetical protein [Methylobacterium marchantiae]|uniref:Uncharacterized protein n=1 Tax=Methylobacterium marchantiae TaxID=600331 RepID=A0ABW3X3Z8_9HYPH
MTNGDKIKLRAELAGKAMQGLLSRSCAIDFSHLSERDDYSTMTFGKAVAIDAVDMADALMKELGLDGE